MSFDEEWARHVANARADRTNNTRLNQLDDGAGGFARTGPKLSVTPKVLRERARRAENIGGDFAKADDTTMEKTGDARSGLKGFSSAAALGTFQDRWRKQMKHLRTRMDEALPKALSAAANEFQANEDRDKSKYERNS
ncbi:hypothetical protein E0L36_13575 [Streptomyces sp. AJS327]|uniref:type VII secretion target n=1 Tax=Streptomyces sp. AJS327 TaxID=2545265 RepID=UPI0015E02552|nr:type VII secretion target [Streptomyces sp. AJS327]MBA0051890.1 hypothetical protein [Streptomyces sp. AJS327]